MALACPGPPRPAPGNPTPGVLMVMGAPPRPKCGTKTTGRPAQVRTAGRNAYFPQPTETVRPIAGMNFLQPTSFTSAVVVSSGFDSSVLISVGATSSVAGVAVDEVSAGATSSAFGVVV